MTGEEWTIFLLLAILMAKHYVFDFVAQTPYMFLNKGQYGHPGGIVHAGLHALGSVLAILVMPPTFLIALAIVAGEFLIHYHIDWTKEHFERRFQLDPSGSGHFILLGLDQLLHQFTYLGIVIILVSASA